MATLTVGAGGEYKGIGGAVAASHAGDVIKVEPGTYYNNFAIINHSLTIEAATLPASASQSPTVKLVATVPPPLDKGYFIVGTSTTPNPTAMNVTIKGVAISGVHIAARLGDNGAAIRWQAGNLTLKDDWFHNNQEGLLGTPLNPNPTLNAMHLVANHTEVSNNGSDGSTHGIYIGDVASVTLNNDYFHDEHIGHEIKSRAVATTIENSRIFSDAPGQKANDSMQIDLPNGGRDIVSHDVIEKALGSQNPRFIGYGEASVLSGGGPVHATNSLAIEDTTFVNDYGANAHSLWNPGHLPMTATDDSLWKLPLLPGAGNVELPLRPALDFAHPWV